MDLPHAIKQLCHAGPTEAVNTSLGNIGNELKSLQDKLQAKITSNSVTTGTAVHTVHTRILQVLLYSVYSRHYSTVYSRCCYSVLQVLLYTPDTIVYSRYYSILQVLQYTPGTTVHYRYNCILQVLQYTPGTTVYSRYYIILQVLHYTLNGGVVIFII